MANHAWEAVPHRLRQQHSGPTVVRAFRSIARAGLAQMTSTNYAALNLRQQTAQVTTETSANHFRNCGYI